MSKVVKTRARGPSYFRKNPRAPTPELNYNQYLGHKSYDPKFAQYYENDYQNSGLTLPYSSYIGPGNSLNLGHPLTEADVAAKQHDLRYAWHSYKYSKGKITSEEFQKRVETADNQFLRANSWSSLQGFPAILGIGSKHFVEKLTGQLYPGKTQEHSQFQDPEIDEDIEFTPLEKNKDVQSMSDNKRAAEPTSTSDEPASKIASIESALTPEMAQLTGTGGAQASGGASSDGMEVYRIERPLSIFGTTESVYTKSHKFMTFGFADAFISLGVATLGNTVLTSYLAEVPWHIPAFYLNQSEFDLLPPGSRVKEVSISVIYRGSTIQFETAASTTGLATLNQINDIAVANGLNRSGWGSNYSFTSFNMATPAQPMLPTGVGAPRYGPIATYRGMVRDYYGSNNNTAQFNGDIPKHQTGRQTFLYNYWAMTSRGGSTVAAANFMSGGWPCLSSMVQQMDGKTVVNQVVNQSTYKPKLAPLKQPLKTESHGLPFPIQNAALTTEVGGNLVGTRIATVTTANVPPSASNQVLLGTAETVNNLGNANAAPIVDPTFDIYSPIEKIQMGRSGYWGDHDPHIQPSVHIGVQPVPALSSAATLLVEAAFNSWTDTRAYWEVVATMKTVNHQPTAYPYASKPNVPFGENVIWNPTISRPSAIVNPTQDGATFCGLYTNSAAPVS